MSEALFSQSWYRVAPLKLRLRSHVQIYQHRYRNQDWYIIQDRFTGRHHRFSPEAYQLIGLMDGRHTLAQIWQTACERLGDHMPTQDEVIALISQLHRNDLLQTSVLPDFSDLQKRLQQSRRSRLLTPLLSPMAVRFPLLDPDRFLEKTLFLVRPFLSMPMFILWAGLIIFSIFTAASHWTDLTNNLSDKLFGLENLVLLSLIYPLLKVFHEFGHAYMVKKWGGEVHEMGVMLLVFIPIPYVDATSSLAFRHKSQRMLVSAAGIMIELGIAALALLLWINLEPGALRAATFNILLIAGVSTLLFNGNPLLRFDAYYVLTDLLEIPNLGQRSSRYLGYLFKRYLLGVKKIDNPAAGLGEKRWLVIYALASFTYRIIITLKIILFIAGKFFLFGILLAIWIIVMMVVIPLWKLFNYLIRDVEMRRKRIRILVTTIIPALCIAGIIGFVPVPYSTVCEGISWAPDNARVHAAADGFVSEILIPNGSQVSSGTPLIRCHDPLLSAAIEILRARRKEFEARYNISLITDRTQAELLKEELSQIDAELKNTEERLQALTLHSRSNGIFVIPDASDLPGRFIKRGTPVGYILNADNMQIRALVGQQDIDQVRADTQKVEGRLTESVNQVFSTRILREIPAASQELPSIALSLEGGGPFALDPRQPDKPLAIERLFQFAIAMPPGLTHNIDERVYVRFIHTPEPLAMRWFRTIRQTLLKRFAV